MSVNAGVRVLQQVTPRGRAPPHLWERAEPPEGGEDVFHLPSIFLFLPCPQLEGIWAPAAPRHIKTQRSKEKCGEEEREGEERERN